MFQPFTGKKKLDHNRGTGGGPHQSLNPLEERALILANEEQDTLMGLESGIDSG